MQSPRKKVASLICKMVIPFCLSFLIAQLIANFLYPIYDEHDKDGKLVIAIFAPLAGVCSEGNLANWRSAIMEHHPSGIFLCLISAIVFWFSGYVSSFTS